MWDHDFTPLISLQLFDADRFAAHQGKGFFFYRKVAPGGNPLVNLTPEVEAYLIKAHHALEVAAKLQSDGYFPSAVGKAYYAIF